MKSIVITGVSSGIGYAITKVLIENGVQVFGSVRTELDAQRLSKDFGSLYVPLIFDVTDEEKIYQAAATVRKKLQGETLWGLINNAGIVVQSPLIYLPIKDFEKQLAVNLTGQLIVTQAFVPLLGTDKTLLGEPGKIINISSAAGKQPRPLIGAYSISKHGLEAMSEALRIELMIFGIDVVVIGPGPVESAAWEKGKKAFTSEVVEKSVYRHSVELAREMMLERYKHALPADTVGNLVMQILTGKKHKIRYALVPNKLLDWTIPNLLLAKKLGLLKK
jgi:NAD(P)-dependent dehydrogenase (short-subunit alcohol dehydrogenase family)